MGGARHGRSPLIRVPDPFGLLDTSTHYKVVSSSVNHYYFYYYYYYYYYYYFDYY